MDFHKVNGIEYCIDDRVPAIRVKGSSKDLCLYVSKVASKLGHSEPDLQGLAFLMEEYEANRLGMEDLESQLHPYEFTFVNHRFLFHVDLFEEYGNKGELYFNLFPNVSNPENFEKVKSTWEAVSQEE